MINAQKSEFQEKNEENRRKIAGLEAKIEVLMEKLRISESKSLEIEDLQAENSKLLENNRIFSKKLEEMKNLEYKLKVLSQEDQENFEEIRKRISKKDPLLENRAKNVNVLESLNREIEDLKVNRNNLKENIEMRLKMLSQNIDSDFSRTNNSFN